MTLSRRLRYVPGFTALLLLATVAGLPAQQTPSSIHTPVPRVVWFSGAFHPADGGTVHPQETVTAAVYRDQAGGDALWSETQTVTIGADGRYSLLLGSTSSDGLPLDLFTAGEPRWIGVTFQRAAEIEQPRVTLASVPYAIKAADADTLGGKPASAYRLADPDTSSESSATPTQRSAANNSALPVTAGTPGYLGVFTDGSSLGNSTMYQFGGYIGQGTTMPVDAFHVSFTDAVGAITGYAVQNLSAAGYSGMLFYDQAGALAQFQGFNNTSHEYRINNIASGATINFMIGASSKFKIANSGNIGIGVASPASTLDVAGDINMTGALQRAGTTVLHVPANGTGNIGVGGSAFGNNTNTGSSNTAVGFNALQSNSGGGYNTAIGQAAMQGNQTGSQNTAVGMYTNINNSSGSLNTAIGWGALANSSSGSSNIAIGYLAGSQVSTGNNNIDIGHEGTFDDTAFIRIGTFGTQTKFFAAGVAGATVTNNVPVLVNILTGQLGTISSSRRYKDDIQDMGEASRGLLRLRPVTFRYKAPFDDGSKPIQYGLIAEEVAEVYPDLVARSADGQIETVKYQLLDVLLLNEVQRQQNEMQKQKAEIDDLRQRLARLEAALTARQ